MSGMYQRRALPDMKIPVDSKTKKWAGLAALPLFGTLLAAALALGACQGTTCTGPDCGCDGSGDCIISCERDGCDLNCSQTSGTCGAVCGDDCAFECQGAEHCSSYSGEDSTIECSNVSSCAAQCGENCKYSAEEVTSVSVKVGPNSEVSCEKLSTCEVECEGTCELTCANISDCQVRCADGSRDSRTGVGAAVTIGCP